MILDETAVRNLAQQSANTSGRAQSIYQRKDGSYITCPQGMLAEVRKFLKQNEQVRFVATLEPKFD